MCFIIYVVLYMCNEKIATYVVTTESTIVCLFNWLCDLMATNRCLEPTCHICHIGRAWLQSTVTSPKGHWSTNAKP